VDMCLGKGKITPNRKRHYGIIHNHRYENNKPHNTGSFQIQQAPLFSFMYVYLNSLRVLNFPTQQELLEFTASMLSDFFLISWHSSTTLISKRMEDLSMKIIERDFKNFLLKFQQALLK
jgi:hypothetical protein